MIKIIFDRTELKGTCYIEVLPGKYNGECWNDNSIFLTERDFGYIEPIFQRCYPSYDHYAFNEMTREVWNKVFLEIEELKLYLSNSPSKKEISTRVGFIFNTTENEYMNTFDESNKLLIKFLDDFHRWASEKLNDYEYISVLGL